MRYLTMMFCLLLSATAVAEDPSVRVRGQTITMTAPHCTLRGRAHGQDEYNTFWSVTTQRCGYLHITEGVIIVQKVEDHCTAIVRLDGMDGGYPDRVQFSYGVECP